jgi:hypothetical protein
LASDEPYDLKLVEDFGAKLTKTLVEKLSVRQKPSLRLSNLGKPCGRQLWYSVNKPELAEPLSAAARIKFLIGDIVEEVLLFLSAAAGHKVERMQQDVNLHGVRGHIDATIDGDLVDSKSASPAGFKKFQDHKVLQDDPFGYATQLGGYLSGLSSTDDDVNPDRAHYLALDKTNGYITLDTYSRQDLVPEDDFESLVRSRKQMLSWPHPPARAFGDLKDGESGNRKLGLECSYCPFKKECWPNLRAFKYSRGPRFLTRVVREPDVPELKLHEVNEE